MKIDETLRRIDTETQLTRMEQADRLKMPSSNVSKLLNNKNPTIKTVVKFLDIFKAELIIKYKNKQYKIK
jgi:predicted transcriptional regulator